jgi:membrane protease YdiL (CAAX protease family)
MSPWSTLLWGWAGQPPHTADQAFERRVWDRVDTIEMLAKNRPLVFVLLTLLIWLFLGAVLVVGSAALLRVPIIEDVPQMIGTLGATFVLLVIAGRMGWLRSMGIASFGGWRVWLMAIPLLVYMIPAYLYGFFGDVSFDLSVFARSDAARRILVRDGIVGFVEETLFRGIILYALVRAWGKSKGGLIASVIVQAALFGVLHVLQIVAGSSLVTALMVTMNSFVSGIWWGVMVLRWGSLWPVIVLHSLSNISVLVKGMSSAYIEPATTAYARATLLEVPLLALGVWLLLRTATRSEMEDEL